jgi:MSHA biogenesis protein MshM
MYNLYYGLTEKPFNLTPDTEFYFHSVTHQSALETLLVAIKNGDGFIKLTGEVGTGKTLLCRKLLDILDTRYETVFIPNPYMSCDSLLSAVVSELGLQQRVRNNNYLECINQHLILNARENRQTVILLDEAQSLPIESLEAIRLLSNLETKKKKLVQIVLFGQPELDRKLADHSIRQLRQRIVHACEIKQLSSRALGAYVQHRLESAGYFGAPLFSDKAMRYLFKKTRGIPRLINLLCDKSMMLAYSSGDYYVSEKHVLKAAQDSQQVRTWKGGRIRTAAQLGLYTLLSVSLSSGMYTLI